MTRHCVELFGDELTLNSNLFALLTYHRDAFNQWLHLTFKASNRFHRAIDEHSNSHHRNCDNDKRRRNHNHDPEERIASGYLKGQESHLLVIADFRLPIEEKLEIGNLQSAMI